MKRASIPVLLCAALLASAPAWAHHPLFAEVPPTSYALALQVENPEVSQVYYSAVDPASPQTWLGFTGSAGQQIYLSLGMPVIDRLRRYRPKLALIGPGLQPIELPFETPAAAGGIVFVPAGEPRFFHEPFTGTDSWILLEATVRLPASGRFYVVAYPESEAQQGDKLWVSIGTEEKWGFRDLMSFGKIKRFVREFHEVP